MIVKTTNAFFSILLCCILFSVPHRQAQGTDNSVFLGGLPNFFDKAHLPTPRTISLTIGGLTRAYTYVEELGGGGYARTIHVIDQATGTHHALSIVNPDRVTKTSYYRHPEFFKKEAFKSSKNLAQLRLVDRADVYVGGSFSYEFNVATLSPLYTPERQWLLAAKDQSSTAATLLTNLKLSQKVRRDILAAMHDLSRDGLVHRDIKPSNIVIDGTVNDLLEGKASARLIDFDLVNAIDGTKGDPISGTASYIAPEYINMNASDVERRYADLYSLGLTSFEIISGKSLMGELFKVESTAQLIHVLRNPESFRGIEVHSNDFFRQAAALIEKSNLSADQKRDAYQLLNAEKTQIQRLISLDLKQRVAAVATENEAFANELKLGGIEINVSKVFSAYCPQISAAANIEQADTVAFSLAP